MKYIACSLAVACFISCGCESLPFDGSRQSLREAIGPPDRESRLPARAELSNPPTNHAQSDDVYRQLFDQRKTLDTIDPNEYEDLRAILERTPPSLQPLVVQEIVLKAREEKLAEQEAAQPHSDEQPTNVVKPAAEHASYQRSPVEPAEKRFARARPDEPRRQVQPANFVDDREPNPPVSIAEIQEHSNNDDWQIEVAAATEALEQSLSRKDVDQKQRALGETYLRLLKLIAADTEAAVSPISQLDAAQQEFWKHQLHALSVMLDQKDHPLHDRRAALALESLRKAVDQLSANSSLEVRNVTFCFAVDSYGQYKEFAKYQFKPNDQVLLYAEIDNFTAQQTNRGHWETALSGSYQIYDQQGSKVAERNFPVETEVCRNRRRDFFIPYRVYIPKVNPGRYNLQLTMRDVKGKKTGQSALIEFTVTE